LLLEEPKIPSVGFSSLTAAIRLFGFVGFTAIVVSGWLPSNG
jgi:hypothetical protein